MQGQTLQEKLKKVEARIDELVEQKAVLLSKISEEKMTEEREEIEIMRRSKQASLGQKS